MLLTKSNFGSPLQKRHPSSQNDLLASPCVLPTAPTIFPGAIPIQLSNSQGKRAGKQPTQGKTSIGKTSIGTAPRSRDAWRPSWCRNAPPRKIKRAQGRPGAGRNPWPACRKKCRRQSPQVQPNHPSLRDGVTVSFVLSPVTIAWLPPSPAKLLPPAWRLLRSARTTRLRRPRRHRSSARQARADATRVHRIPHPRFVTIGRNAPLHRGGTVRMMLVIWGRWQPREGATEWHDGQFVHGGCAVGAQVWRASGPPLRNPAMRLIPAGKRPPRNAIIKWTGLAP
jgi:hypothetical protein